jgi:hypothetical protein
MDIIDRDNRLKCAKNLANIFKASLVRIGTTVRTTLVVAPYHTIVSFDMDLFFMFSSSVFLSPTGSVFFMKWDTITL